MNTFNFVLQPQLYSYIYYITIFILCVSTVLFYASASGDSIFNLKKTSEYRSMALAGFITLILILFLGFRPTSGVYFVDMGYYAHSYNYIYKEYVPLDFSTEWLWANFSYFCKDFGLSENEYFAVCELLYIGFMLLACIKLSKNNLWVALLFCFSSFSFFSYGVNGIRNGIACSILMYAIALLTGNKKEIFISIILMIISYGIHHSIFLPAFCSIAALFLIKEPKYAIAFWGASIFISLIAGNIIGDFFSTLGFDKRVSYFEESSMIEIDDSSIVDDRFRWDFLLYSAMPILLVWYLTMKRDFKDKSFNLLANTYILANAFWIMVIRANFSNRFAYLSWFLYPIVIFYPLLRFKIWDNQDRNSALILLAYSGFTFFMQFVYYAK